MTHTEIMVFTMPTCTMVRCGHTYRTRWKLTGRKPGGLNLARGH
jgi:hypothetical protein